LLSVKFIHTDDAIDLDKVFMMTRDGTCFAPGFLTGNGPEKRENGQMGIHVSRQEMGWEMGRALSGFPVFPSASRFCSDQFIGVQCTKRGIRGRKELSLTAHPKYLNRDS
jgi:hypothetical protein